jgi:CysZ protein
MSIQAIKGAHYFLDGLKLIFQPGLRRYVFIPLTINIILFVTMFFIAKHYMTEFNVWFENHIPQWLNWLGGVLWILFFISFVLIMLYTFVTFANLISAPFNSLLSEKVEFILTGKKLEDRSLITICKDIPRIIGRQFAIIGYYLPRAFLLLILFFIPIVQIVAAGLWFLFNAWFMSLQYLDYPTDNHQIPLRDVRTWIRVRRGSSFCFGLSVLIASMIPIVNFFVVPAAVAGATKFFIEN